MWPFSRNIGLEESELFRGFTDCHCHLLPRVGDGANTLQESEIALSRFEELGIRTIWLTPHIMASKANTTALLRQRFDKLKSAYNGPITLHLSAEYMLDHLFCERFRDSDLLPWGKYANRLLVETSDFNAPKQFHHMLACIKAKGLSPILAHPERCLYANLLDYIELKSKGIEFQLNLFSLVGQYGDEAKEKAEMLLKEGLYEYVGTDFHSLRELESALQEDIDKKIMDRVKRIVRWQNYCQN